MAEQLPIFTDEGGEAAGEMPAKPAKPAGINARSSLREVLGEFDTVMLLKGFTDNTIKAFQADLRILTDFIPNSRPINQVSTRDLEGFLTYLKRDRGRPCNPKSYARRLTTLKVLFAWLVEAGVLAVDPAAPLVHTPVRTPLPRVLTDGQVGRLRDAAREMRSADEPDPRPLLLIELLLQTGIKKGECMGIHLAHLDLSSPGESQLRVRYAQVRQQYKERTLRLQRGIVPLIRAYRDRYRPAEHLFECTARNLEYVLRDAARLAGIPEGVSFEMLRWTSAVRDFRDGMDHETLRRKLGLSKLRWRETAEKLKQLTDAPL